LKKIPLFFVLQRKTNNKQQVEKTITVPLRILLLYCYFAFSVFLNNYYSEQNEFVLMVIN